MSKKVITLILVFLMTFPFTVKAEESHLGEFSDDRRIESGKVVKYYKHLTPLATGMDTITFEVDKDTFTSEVNAIRNGETLRDGTGEVTYEGTYEELTLIYYRTDAATNTYDVYAEANWLVLPSRRDYDFMIISFPAQTVTSTTNYYQVQRYVRNNVTYSKDTRYDTAEDYLQYIGIPYYQAAHSLGNSGYSYGNGALFDLYTGTATNIKTMFQEQISGLDVTKKMCVVHKHKTSSTSLPLGYVGIYFNDNVGGQYHLTTIGMASQSYNYYESLFSTASSCFHMYDI